MMNNHGSYAGLVLAIALYLLIFILFRQIFPSGILFYQGLFLAFLISLAQLVLQRHLAPESNFVKDPLLALFICYSFLITVPTTVDRAYSVKMLIDISQYPEGLTEERIAQRFSLDYASTPSVKKRIDEQIATGSIIENEHGHYVLTPIGKLIVNSFNATTFAFSLQKNQVKGP